MDLVSILASACVMVNPVAQHSRKNRITSGDFRVLSIWVITTSLASGNHDKVGCGSIPDVLKRETSPRPALPSNALCMLGTAENQVAPCSRAIGQKLKALKRGGTTTVPPDRNVDIVEATRPWMWKSGMTHSATSLAVRS